MPPKKKKVGFAADASAPKSKPSATNAAVVGNKNLSSDTSDAIKRIKRDQLFKVAMEQLVQLDCEAEREGSLYNIGYCSDVVSLGALAGGAGAAVNDIQEGDGQEEGEDGGILGLNDEDSNQNVDDDDDDDDDPFAAAAAAEQKKQNKKKPVRRQRVNTMEMQEGITPFNSAVLDRALASPADWSFLGSAAAAGRGKKGTTASSAATAAFEENPQSRKLLSSSASVVDGDTHYQWFRTRSRKLDRMKATWAASGMTPEQIARKVML